ncbi:BLUF domain-containing protein [Endozoicomonas lisbonensis]|uniref:BLUF domain-containing protein n=1 Tax=Endozoicomonas lisbonensis TaxID=3120522 RepID=A0ABV2SIX9_9GAMM
MHLIIYTSRYTGEASQITDDLRTITQTAKNNNPALNITGLLFYHNQQFMQIIEGEKPDLEGLMKVVTADPRHKEVIRIVDQEVPERGFSDWNMDSFNLAEQQQLTPDQLKAIKELYSQNFAMQSNSVVDFYRSMLSDDKADYC